MILFGRNLEQVVRAVLDNVYAIMLTNNAHTNLALWAWVMIWAFHHSYL